MAYVDTLFNSNFLEYASYVIKDRAIPHIDDGMKPVQRRIIHSLLEMDDGKFHKVANIVGHCMKYHPHGDASIFSALVVLANKDFFIEKQGNFGNILTGDEPSASRYIEARIAPLAKEILYNPELTTYEGSYDGRNKEPVTFPAKIPVALIHGAEGIAVGMSTRILPHNFIEGLEAEIAALKRKKFKLYPDFPGGGLVDVTDYEDGNGKVLVRAKLDTSDPKRIVIREIPFGSTTESLIASIENASRKNKIKIAGIYDYTSEEVEIEIKLARNVYSQEVVDALYAFTECENSISVNMLLINENRPLSTSVTEVIKYHSKQLQLILEKELKNEQAHLRDKFHALTLEQIFIEERIYKDIEEKKTAESVIQAVFDGLAPFTSKIRRKVTQEDVEKLLRIPIRRISRYDIDKAKKEMRDIQNRLKKIAEHLSNIQTYAVNLLEDLTERYREQYPRKTEVVRFSKTDVREAALRNLSLKYNATSGYLGYALGDGKHVLDVSVYDRILVIRRSGAYSVIDVPEKLFVDKGMLYCGLADKEELAKKIFTIVYKDNKSGMAYIKRCKIEKYILGKGYTLIGDDCSILKFTDKQNATLVVSYKHKPQIRILEESFKLKDFLVKSVKAAGVRLSTREVKSVKLLSAKKQVNKKVRST